MDTTKPLNNMQAGASLPTPSEGRPRVQSLIAQASHVHSLIAQASRVHSLNQRARGTNPKTPLVELKNAVLAPVDRAPFACSSAQASHVQSKIAHAQQHPFKTCIRDINMDDCKHTCEADDTCIVAQYTRTDDSSGQCMIFKYHPDYRYIMSNTEWVKPGQDGQPDSYIWYDNSRVGLDASIENAVFSGVYVYLYSEPHYIGVNTLVPMRQPTPDNPYPVAYPLIGTTYENAQPFKLVMRYSNWGVVYKPISKGGGFSISLPLTTLSLGTFQDETTHTFNIRMVPAEQPIVDEHFIFTCVPVAQSLDETHGFTDQMWIEYGDPVYLYHPITRQYVYLDQRHSRLSSDHATVFTIRTAPY